MDDAAPRMGPSNWTIECTIPTMAVPDLEVGISYYKKLGFEVDWRFPDDDPTHAGLVLGNASIMLARCEPDVTADLYFIVDDVAACHAHVLAQAPWEMAEAAGSLAKNDRCPPKASLHAPNAPKDTEYGLRDFAVIDPWGHCLTFGQVTRDA